MDKRLLHHYNSELRYLREMGAEFAEEFPRIAGRLGMEGIDVADPYVERLLEGFAFMAARIRVKMDAEFPRFTHGMLETIYPHYLAPTPSMAVVQFKPDYRDDAVSKGVTLPRHTMLRSQLGRGDQTVCEYRTAHATTLWPIELVEARYMVQSAGTLGLGPELAGKAAVQLRLRAMGSTPIQGIDLDRLSLFLRGSGDTATRLYQQIIAHGRRIVVQPSARPAPWQHVAGPQNIRRVGLANEHALLPYDARSFHGYRLLHEYFAFPQRFLFLDLCSLAKGMARCEEKEVEVIVVLDEADVELENIVSAENFALHCTPAINLLEKRCDRIHVTERFSEHHVVPDRVKPRDFEVYRVQSVTGYGAGAQDATTFKSFYAAAGSEDDADATAYYAVNRVPRVVSAEAKQKPRSRYVGSEVFVSLVDGQAAPYPCDLKQLAVTALCTNRDLPLRMPLGRGKTDFTPEGGLPVQSVRCVAGPTSPVPSFAEGETAWRLISHLSTNYLSLTDTAGGEAAAMLREVMSLYAALTDASQRRQIEGLLSVSSRPITRRIPLAGPVTFGRGLEVSVTFDDAAFEGVGCFILGGVLEQFFTRHVSINSFTQTVVRTTDGEELIRWPVRMGTRASF